LTSAPHRHITRLVRELSATELAGYRNDLKGAA
jgi:hypothetical protein